MYSNFCKDGKLSAEKSGKKKLRNIANHVFTFTVKVDIIEIIRFKVVISF